MNSIDLEQLKNVLEYDINRELIVYFLSLLEKKSSSERNRPLGLGLNPTAKTYKKCFSYLYEPTEVNGEIVAGENLAALEKTGVISIELKDKKYTFDLYKRKAMIYFNTEFEEVCRELLDMKISNYKEKWKEAIKASTLNKNIKALLLNMQPIQIKEKSAKSVIVNIENYLKLDRANDLIREASSFIFWGHSKILDNRPDFWNILKIQQQPIQILVSLKSENCKKILFIENKQTFESLQRNNSLAKKYILIYLSGFMGTASRLINKKYRSFYINPNTRNTIAKEYLHAIFDSQSDFNYYFWGDLDYEGINIYLSLKKLFNSVELWKPGYDKMIGMLSTSNGHSPSMAKKKDQNKPGKTFNTYIDDILIPQMEDKGFFDQEGIIFTDL
ncbi:MAG: Wadjet anti-phage system protein JetD domain-containing protein [Sulfurimonas sp.]